MFDTTLKSRHSVWHCTVIPKQLLDRKVREDRKLRVHWGDAGNDAGNFVVWPCEVNIVGLFLWFCFLLDNLLIPLLVPSVVRFSHGVSAGKKFYMC